ncbi:MAG: replication protein [bacterium]
MVKKLRLIIKKEKIPSKNFTKVPNIILEELIKNNFNGSQYQILLAIIRRTFGWHKTYTPIARSLYERMCSKTSNSLERAIKELRKRNIIKKHGEGRYGAVWSISEDIKLWDKRLPPKIKSEMAKKLPLNELISLPPLSDKTTRQVPLEKGDIDRKGLLKEKAKQDNYETNPLKSDDDYLEIQKELNYPVYPKDAIASPNYLVNKYFQYYRELYKEEPDAFRKNVARKYFSKLVVDHEGYYDQNDEPGNRVHDMGCVLHWWMFKKTNVSKTVRNSKFNPYFFYLDVRKLFKAFTADMNLCAEYHVYRFYDHMFD